MDDWSAESVIAVVGIASGVVTTLAGLGTQVALNRSRAKAEQNRRRVSDLEGACREAGKTITRAFLLVAGLAAVQNDHLVRPATQLQEILETEASTDTRHASELLRFYGAPANVTAAYQHFRDSVNKIVRAVGKHSPSDELSKSDQAELKALVKGADEALMDFYRQGGKAVRQLDGGK